MECCGKTAVGRELARMANIPFVDIDDEVEKEAGMTVAEILKKEGREGLLKRAKDALLKASSGDWQIVACNAEDPLDDENLKRMQDTGAVAFLDVPLDLLEKRFDFSRHAGSIEGSSALRELYEKRRPAYVASCGVQLNYTHADPADAAYDLLRIFYPDYFWR